MREAHDPLAMSAVAGEVSGTGEAGRWPAISARNLAQLWEHTARAMGQRWARWDDAWAADAGSPSPVPNSATLLRPLDAADTGELVARLAAFYAAGQGGPWMLWSAWPAPDLRPYGFDLAGTPPLMVRPAGKALPPLPPPPPSLRILEVHDEATLAAFDAVFINGYPLHEIQAAGIRRLYDTRILGGPFRLWVGYAGAEPVTVASAFVDEHAIGIYTVATLPHARGNGYGAAMTAHAAQVAPWLPAELQASDDGRSVYRRLGFRDIARYTLWIHQRTE